MPNYDLNLATNRYRLAMRKLLYFAYNTCSMPYNMATNDTTTE